MVMPARRSDRNLARVYLGAHSSMGTKYFTRLHAAAQPDCCFRWRNGSSGKNVSLRSDRNDAKDDLGLVRFTFLRWWWCCCGSSNISILTKTDGKKVLPQREGSDIALYIEGGSG